MRHCRETLIPGETEVYPGRSIVHRFLVSQAAVDVESVDEEDKA